MRGLQQALNTAIQRHPECAPEGQRLHAMLARYDFEAVLEQLMRAFRETSAQAL
jgi:hypothetical protein